ncbi:hypothetical protein FFLO_05122 [Filobasidium floriforme]|uniref:Ketoreductase domain-containing protein n=1 Tax=Filobasidium floriforme TaxID=5210 RepID=A0A8K0JJ25_9TREE|nr:hypothetical protein FFLO_05122 [Filobasidium floriforme]
MVGTGWNIDLSGKAIIVTGGNRGIGRAIAEQAAQAGAHVAIVYHSSPDAPQVADKIAEDYNVRSKAYQADTSDQKKMHEIVKQVYDDLGPVGGIVCNAGRAAQKPALEATREDFDACFETNVWGAFVSAQACAALWKEHGYQNGKVVIVSSISGSIANKGSQQCFYNASKGAANMLAKCLAMEWADMGINVNCINPGYVETDMTAGFLKDEEKKAEKMKDVPMGRPSQPEEQAGMAIMLLSDRASYITGSTTMIDGGLTIW